MDKLTREEQLRVQAMTLAHNMQYIATQRPTEGDVFALSDRVEQWIKNGTAAVVSLDKAAVERAQAASGHPFMGVSNDEKGALQCAICGYGVEYHRAITN